MIRVIRDVFLDGSFIRQSHLRVGRFVYNSAIVGEAPKRWAERRRLPGAAPLFLASFAGNQPVLLFSLGEKLLFSVISTSFP